MFLVCAIQYLAFVDWGNCEVAHIFALDTTRYMFTFFLQEIALVRFFLKKDEITLTDNIMGCIK